MAMNSMTLNQKIANSLTQKLNNAGDAKNRGNIKTAQNILDALLNEIDAQTEKHIIKDASKILIEDAMVLIDSLK